MSALNVKVFKKSWKFYTSHHYFDLELNNYDKLSDFIEQVKNNDESVIKYSPGVNGFDISNFIFDINYVNDEANVIYNGLVGV